MKCVVRIVLFFLLVLLLSPQLLNAQSHCVETSYTSYQIPDSVLMIRSSIEVGSSSNSDIDYEVIDDVLIIKSSYKREEFRICYNYVLKKHEVVKPAVPENWYDSTARFTNSVPIQEKTDQTTQELLGLGGIEINGAYMRSVSGGGQQSAMMHSVMDLTISGNISEDLKLKARMTDQQMPFEPEGNTQRLQDFDRVNVQLIHENWRLYLNFQE